MTMTANMPDVDGVTIVTGLEPATSWDQGSRSVCWTNEFVSSRSP